MKILPRRIIVITGDGKGKTTSSIGTAIRFYGQGGRVLFFQFVKNKKSLYGEHLFFKNNDGISFYLEPLGDGFKFTDDFFQEDREKFLKIFERVEQKIDLYKNYPKLLVVFDEISFVLKWGWLTQEEFIKVLDKYKKVNFILTGRYMPEWVFNIADTVSIIEEKKHPYNEGFNAQIGIEF